MTDEELNRRFDHLEEVVALSAAAARLRPALSEDELRQRLAQLELMAHYTHTVVKFIASHSKVLTDHLTEAGLLNKGETFMNLAKAGLLVEAGLEAAQGGGQFAQLRKEAGWGSSDTNKKEENDD